MALDATAIRGPLWLLGLSALLASVLAAGSEWHWRVAQAAHRRAESTLAAASREFLSVDEDERLVRARYPEYRRLAAEGLLGEEQRLDWLEALRDADAALKLPAIRYDIDAQQPWRRTLEVDTGPYTLRSSDMTLTLALVHEGDLVRLLERLRTARVGLFSVETCSVGRRATPALPAAAPALDASCTLRWVTLGSPSPTDLAP